MFKTIIGIKAVDLSRVIEKCTGIAGIDKTFQFKIDEKEYGTFLVIHSPEKDQAHKRGLLLCKKYLPVEEGDKYTYSVEEHDDDDG